jgi:methionine-rich copper-binding protein CopC
MRTPALALFFTLAGLSPAFAHAFLTHSNPPVGSTLTTPPTNLLLSYTEGVEVPFCQVTVTDSAGTPVQTAAPQPVPGQPTEMSVPLHITTPGTYTVTWHAVAVDTHKTEGSFKFTVTAP